jgi:hypothetical protein
VESIGQELGDGGNDQFIFGFMAIKHVLLLLIQFPVVFDLDQGVFFYHEIQFDSILV